MDLSVIVPMLNEEDSVTPLYASVRNALDDTDLTWELIIVDDGSIDKTVEMAMRVQAKDHRVRIVKLRRNYGQTPAMVAGIDHARGDVLVTMDGDLQNDPSDIPSLLRTMDQGFDLVVGWRMNRQDKLVSRKVPSRIANWLIGKVTNVPIRDNGCSLKAYRSDLIRKIPLYSEMHRFIPAMASIAGTKVAEIPVKHHARQYGHSKYGLKRIYKVLLDLISIKTIISCVDRPLAFFGKLGFAPIAIGSAFGAFALAPSNVGSILVLGGIALLLFCLGGFLITLGIVSELLIKTSGQRGKHLAELTLVTTP